MDRRAAVWLHREDLEQIEFSQSMNVYPLANLLDKPKPKRPPVSLVWGCFAVAVVVAVLILF